MSIVLFEDAAQVDLDELWEVDEDSAALVFAIVEEFQDDPELGSTLVQHGYRDITDPAYDVSRFVELWHEGLNLYRLKFWDEEGGSVPYRIIYAHHPQNDTIHILGIIPRNINYDTNHPKIRRICDDYGKLGIPAY